LTYFRWFYIALGRRHLLFFIFSLSFPHKLFHNNLNSCLLLTYQKLSAIKCFLFYHCMYNVLNWCRWWSSYIHIIIFILFCYYIYIFFLRFIGSTYIIIHSSMIKMTCSLCHSRPVDHNIYFFTHATMSLRSKYYSCLLHDYCII